MRRSLGIVEVGGGDKVAWWEGAMAGLESGIEKV